MKGMVEIAVFAGLAVGLHLAVLSYDPQGGEDAGGVGGAEVLTLTGAPAAVTEVIEEWTRPPEAQVETPDTLPSQEEVGQEAPEVPHLHLMPAPRAALQVAQMARPPVEMVPEVNKETPPPPKKPDPKPKKTPPKKKPEKREAAPSQKASGKGGAAQAGQSGGQVQTLSKGQRANLIGRWGAQIHRAIARKQRSPKGARGGGRVKLNLRVSRSGKLLSVRVVQASGDAAYARAAVAAVKRVGRFPKAPAQLTNDSYAYTTTLTFKK